MDWVAVCEHIRGNDVRCMGMGKLFVPSPSAIPLPRTKGAQTADSDWKGRIPAFNLTLVITSLFGLLSAFAPSFPLLCLALFGLGTGVGGSMPTDGTLYASFTLNVSSSSRLIYMAPDSWRIFLKLTIIY